MKTQFLFPHSFKWIGCVLFAMGLVMASMLFFSGKSMDKYLVVPVFAIINQDFLGASHFFEVIKNSLFDECAVSFLLIGALFVSFSRLRSEDEFIRQIRLESLIWAVYFNCIVMLLSTIFVYGMDYFVIMGINIFSLLFFFAIRFQIKLYQLRKSAGDDE